VEWGDPRLDERALEAGEIAAQALAFIAPAIRSLTDDPLERIRLLRATIWVLVGRWLAVVEPARRDGEWEEAKAAVMAMAEALRAGRGEGRVQ